MLLRNYFPSWILLSQLLNIFINRLVKFGPDKERLFIGLPFLGKMTNFLRRKIIRICKKFIPHEDVIVYLKPGRRVANNFRSKMSPLWICDCVLFITMRVLFVRVATWDRPPATYVIASQNIRVSVISPTER